MRKVILEEWISLDGYVSDKDGRLDFFTKLVRENYSASDRTAFLDSIDCILFGRKTYEQFASLWPQRPIEKDTLAHKINTGNKIVFSESLRSAPWGEWSDAAIENGDPISKIKTLKATQGRNMVIWGSITLGQTLMKENLLDEIHLHVCPTLLGSGRSLFTHDRSATTLDLLESKHYGPGLVFLKYQLRHKHQIL